MARRALPARETVNLPPLSLRAEVLPESVNPEARTVDLVFSTGATVERADWWTGERYRESLSMDAGAVRLERLNNRAPFLDAHSAYSVASQLGVVEPGSARIVDGRGVATVRFSKRADVEPVWQDVRDGIVANVSVGYRVHQYKRTPANEDTRTPELRHAVDWEPYEISAVPMGADDGAKIRAASEGRKVVTAPCLILTPGAREKERISMDTTERAAVLEPNADGSAPEGYELRADGKCYRLEPAPTEADRATAAERERVDGILAASAAVRRPPNDPVTRQFIKDGTPLVVVQGKFLDTLREGGRDAFGPTPGPSSARVTRDPLESVWAGITLAFLHRINPDVWKLDDNARQYRTHSVVRCAEECLEQRGTRTRHLSKTQIVGLALGLDQRAGLHSTSDFATILADVANKSLMAIYNAAPQTWLPLATRVTLPDFRPLRRAALGEAPALKKVLEHGEFTRGTIAEGKEQMVLLTYGRIFGITRQALVNDDLDAFSRLAVMFGRAARNLESDLVWSQILGNPLMSDGLALFEAATHKNLVTPGTYPSILSLGVARAMLTKQTALDGSTYLSLSARYLIVPPGLETIADQLTAAVTAATSGAVNPFSGKLTVISEPRLEGGIRTPDSPPVTIAGDPLAWYVATSPDQVPMVEYGYLDGETGPALDTRVGFDIDGLETKCRLDFAAKVMDYRGFVKNAGASAPAVFAAGPESDLERERLGAGAPSAGLEPHRRK